MVDTTGSAIILVLLILSVLMVLGLSLLNMDFNHVDIVTNDRAFQAAYYFAEAGLQQQVEILRNHMEEIYFDPKVKSRDSFFMYLMESPIVSPNFEDFEGEKVSINITIKKSKSPEYGDEIIIVSRCSIGRIKRFVLARVQVKWEDPYNEDFILDDSNFSIVEWRETR